MFKCGQNHVFELAAVGCLLIWMMPHTGVTENAK
jgi:hypothetical protein